MSVLLHLSSIERAVLEVLRESGVTKDAEHHARRIAAEVKRLCDALKAPK